MRPVIVPGGGAGVPGWPAVGLGWWEREEGPAQAAEVPRTVPRGAEVPARPGAERSQEFDLVHAGDLDPVAIRFRHQDLVARPDERRQDGHDAAGRIKLRPEIQQIVLVDDRRVLDAGYRRERLRLLLAGDERPVAHGGVAAVGRR